MGVTLRTYQCSDRSEGPGRDGCTLRTDRTRIHQGEHEEGA